MKKLIPILSVFLWLTLGTVDTTAQGPCPDGFPPMFEQRAKNLENLRLLKLMETLELTDEQSPQFISYFADFRKETRQIDDSIQSEIDKLAELLRSDEPAGSVIYDYIDKIENLKTDRYEAIAKFHKNIRGILTPEQMGRAVVFEERFEKELLENVRGFRKGQDTPRNR
jgi:Spy/CpxP family protein refolding chaperone